MFLYEFATTSGHAPDDMTDGLLGDLPPNLDWGISQLRRATVGASIRDIPEVPDRIQVWGNGQGRSIASMAPSFGKR